MVKYRPHRLIWEAVHVQTRETVYLGGGRLKNRVALILRWKLFLVIQFRLTQDLYTLKRFKYELLLI